MVEPRQPPAHPGRPRDSEIDTRILDAARRIFATEGYTAVTISAVAREVGLPRSTVYRRYPSVVALRYAAVFIPATGLQPLAETGDLRADMENHIDANARGFRDRAGVELLRSLMADVLADDAGRAELNAAFIVPRLRQIVDVLERARARGELPEHVDADLAAKAITGTLLYHAVLLDQPVDDTTTRRLLDLLFPSP